MTKKKLRTEILQQLKQLSDEDRRMKEKELHNHLFHSEFWKQANTIGITVSQGIEWDTKEIIIRAWAEDKNICVPKCYPETKEMQFFLITSFNELEKVYYNLLEPNPKRTKAIEKDQIELLVVPGVVFDDHGYRIGFGGGYYDRFLTDFNQMKVSICSLMQFVESVPKESHDIPVQYLITEQGIKKAKD